MLKVAKEWNSTEKEWNLHFRMDLENHFLSISKSFHENVSYKVMLAIKPLLVLHAQAHWIIKLKWPKDQSCNFPLISKVWGGGRTQLFTPNKPGWFTFPVGFRCSHVMRNNTALSRGIVKDSPQVWISLFWVESMAVLWWICGFIFSYTIFQAFRTCNIVFAKFNLNLWKIRWKSKNWQNVTYCTSM